MAPFSLPASKNLTGGEGGILICDDREVYERAMSMGTHPHRLVVELELPEFREKIDSLAFNYRMHSMSAALANTQLKYLEEWTQARGRNAQRLYDGVRDLPCVAIPEPLLETERHAYYKIPFTYRPGVIPLSRSEFVEALKAEGVNAGDYVRVPLYLRPRFQNHDYFGRGYPWAIANEPVVYRRGDCPVAEEMAHVEFQVGGNYYVDSAELMSEIPRHSTRSVTTRRRCGRISMPGAPANRRRWRGGHPSERGSTRSLDRSRLCVHFTRGATSLARYSGTASSSKLKCWNWTSCRPISPNFPSVSTTSSVVPTIRPRAFAPSR